MLFISLTINSPFSFTVKQNGWLLKLKLLVKKPGLSDIKE